MAAAEGGQKGTVFCIGVGPGDPELLTLKAVRMIGECDVIAFAGRRAEDSAAYRIAEAAVPQIRQKTLLPVDMPMTKDGRKLAKAHQKGAAKIEAALGKGQSVGYLILGDPSVYGSFTYLHRILRRDGYDVVFCSGVPSFCAAAARLGISLTEGEEELRIVTTAAGERESNRAADEKQESNRAADEKQESGRAADESPGGTRVIMKAGPGIGRLKARLKDDPGEVYFAEKCGRPGERLARSAEEIPEDAGYMSLVIVKGTGNRGPDN